MVSRRREKLLKSRAAKKLSKATSYRERESKLPDPNTKYGKRWWARRRGEPMAARPVPPWWSRLVSFAGHETLEAIRQARERAQRLMEGPAHSLDYVEVN